MPSKPASSASAGALRLACLALPLAGLLAACSGGRRTDALAGLGVAGPTSTLSLACVNSENTVKSMAYLQSWKLGHAGADTDTLFNGGLRAVLGRHFKAVVQADGVEQALAVKSDLVAVVDAWAEHRGFGLGYVQMSAAVHFLTPDKREVVAVETKRRRYVSPLGITPLGPLAWGSALTALQRDVEGDLEKAVAASPGLAEYARTRAVGPAPAAAAGETFHSDVDAPAYKSREDPDAFAVVMGVERYASLPEARFAERDAAAMREHLVALGTPPRNIAFLTGASATRTGLAKNVETWLPNNVNARSTVYFYYSGHGAPDPRSGQAYLVPVDGDPGYLEDTGYPLKRLYERLSALRARRVVVVLDSCFSGAGGRSVLAKGTRPLVVTVAQEPPAAASLSALSASRGDEVSGTDDDQGHGLFTYYLLRGLNGEAKDAGGKVTLRSLYDYLSPRVQDEARRVNRGQSPVLSSPRPEAVVLRAE